jgi:phosphatidylglycerophosphate synthase
MVADYMLISVVVLGIYMHIYVRINILQLQILLICLIREILEKFYICRKYP